MPMPVRVPDLLTAMPGMVPAATAMMKRRFASHNVATIAELLDAARETGVRLIACQMTMDVFGYAGGREVENSQLDVIVNHTTM
jgi:peroxiredoxin family protein